MIVRDDAASLPVLPEFPVLDDVAFRDLLIEWDGLADTHSRLKPIVDPLLAVAAAVHEEQPFPPDTWSDWEAADLVALLNRTAEIDLGLALAFIPVRYFARLWLDCRGDAGTLAAQCEPLFACHVARSGTPRAAEYVEGYALLIERWRSARTEDLRRVEGAPVGVIQAMLLRGAESKSKRALDILTRPSAAKEIPALRGAAAAMKRLEQADQALFTSRFYDKDRHLKDARGEMNEAIAQRLSPLRDLCFRDLYTKLLGGELERLPLDLNQAAQGKLRKAKAKKRRPQNNPGFSERPEDLPSEALHSEGFGPAVDQILRLIEQHRGHADARIVGAYLESGPKMVDVAADLGVAAKTIQRVFRRIRKDQALRAALSAILRD